MFPEPVLPRSISKPDQNQTTSLPPVPNISWSLSHWLECMNILAGMIDRLQEIAATSGSENGPQLLEKVDSLRKDFERQQGHGNQFLQLTEEYTMRYQRDISAEIQQQGSLQETLGAQEKMAKELYGLAVNLQKSFQTGIVDLIKKFRETSRVTFYHQKDQLLMPLIFSAAASGGWRPVWRDRLHSSLDRTLSYRSREILEGRDSLCVHSTQNGSCQSRGCGALENVST